MSAMTGAVGMPLPANDGWAILADPPGERDLGLGGYWEESLARSVRRRGARRRTPLVARGSARISIALAAVALTGPTAGAMAAAKSATTTVSVGLSRGDSGPQVRALQRALGIVADGIFGPQTEQAVRSFQAAHGLETTGAVGPRTASALGSGAGATSVAAPTNAPRAGGGSATVRAVQRVLGVDVDGRIGPQTRGALRAFQRAHGLPAHGRADAATLQALGVAAQAPGSSGTSGTNGTTGTTGTAIPVSDPAGGTDGTSSDGTTTAAPSPASSGAQAVVDAAMSKIGASYASGGNGPSSFDCSGLVAWAMRQAGVSVPRTSFAQFGSGTAVDRSEIQAGDLVFFATNGPGASDVGIAVSATSAVSATTHGVMTHSILSGYWGAHYVGARRVA
ncbi:MAG: peptidoglycan DL-endopeptidase CwlO [Solirubrobacteraceae bacterium]|jgi:cell wall-associated NlpC family hydrolase|nr:peptidoglycan DL-endopeptidase CwlO [Solirubrobacteraceae bacterium]